MRPILAQFELAGQLYVFHSYSTFMVLAWLAAVALATYVAHRRDLQWKRVLALLAISLTVGVVASRAFDLFIAADFYADDPSRILSLDFQGFSLYGGLLGSGLTGLVFSRLWSIPLWRLADSTVPGMAIGVVFMRIGCFLNGCCFGNPTELPWGVTYPSGSAAWTQQFVDGQTGLLGIMGFVHPVHPTQLYEMGGAVLLCCVALVLMRRKTPDGVAFLVFATGFTLVRLGNGFLRARQSWITAPEWFYPAFYMALALVFVWLLLLRVRSRSDIE